MDLLIPPGLSEGEIFDHIARINHKDLIKTIAAAGFSLIELSGDLDLLLPQFYTPKSIQDLKNLKSSLGLQFTVHLPLWSVEPSTMLGSVRSGSVDALINHIQIVEPLSPEIYVLHATGALASEFSRMPIPEAVKGFVLNQFNTFAKSSVRRLLDETGIPSRKLAVETIEFPFDLTLELAEEMDVSICFDTGHVLAGFSGPIDIIEALDRCIPRLIEIHLHDCPKHSNIISKPQGKDHQSLGKGDLNLDLFFSRLEEVNFSGPLIFELPLDQALDSLNLIQRKRPNMHHLF